MRAPSLLLAAFLSLGAVACTSSARPAPATPANPPPAEPVNVGTTVITANESGTAAELFERGKKLFFQDKFKEAAETFDLVQKGDPQGRLAPVALFHAGLSYEGAGEPETALKRYAELIQQFPKDETVKNALFRTGRIQVNLDRWQPLGANADALLQRADLTIPEAIEAYGEKAMSLVETGDEEKAAHFVEKARDLMEKNHIGEMGKIPDEVAQVFFALGEVRRVKSERIKFDPVPPNFGDVFEQRAQGLLDAQSAFTDTMRTTDVAWATRAGYRVGQLYAQLHKDVMTVKPPAVAKTDKDKQLFEGAMRLRYRVLLEKGLKMMDAVLQMQQRVGEETPWTSKVKEAKANLERDLAAENAELKKLPISEADLKKLLDKLQEKRDAERK